MLRPDILIAREFCPIWPSILLPTFSTFGIITLILCSVSNAAPVSVLYDELNLQTRGNLPSVANKFTTCPTAAQLLHAMSPHLPQLHNNALFWTDVGLPIVEQLAVKKGKKHLRDLFPDNVRIELKRLCVNEYSPHEDFLLMSEAMATLASGEAWVLKETALGSGPADIFWEREFTTLKNLRRVTQLWRVDRSGRKIERINI